MVECGFQERGNSLLNRACARRQRRERLMISEGQIEPFCTLMRLSSSLCARSECGPRRRKKKAQERPGLGRRDGLHQGVR